MSSNAVRKSVDKIFDSSQFSVCVIAEIGLNHNGDLELAKKLIDVAWLAGCDVAKFQKRDVKNLAVGSVLDAVDGRFPAFGGTYREIREHLEFDLGQYRELKAHAEGRGLQFLATAFDIESTDFLLDLGVSSFKVASHSLTNLPLLDYIARTKKPTIMSTGMCTLQEIDVAVGLFRKHDAPLCLLHCVSAYPTPYEQSNLRLLAHYMERYSLPIGYSGHEIGWLPTVGAVALGARCVERHITTDKTMMGFDHKLSLNPDELIGMVRDIRQMEQILGTGQKSVSDTESITRQKYHVSYVSTRLIASGATITEEMLTLKNPGTGISAHLKDKVLGRRTKVAIDKDVLINFDMFE